MKKIKKPYYFLILFIVLLSFIFYNGSLYIPVYQDGEFFIGEWIFRESSRGTIIGNPDFVPSFIEITEENFIEKYEQQSKQLGYTHVIKAVPLRVDSNFKTAFLINELYYIDYDEGFFIMDAEAYKNDTKFFNEVYRTLLVTLDPDAEIEEFENFLNQNREIQFLDYASLYLSSKVDFRFNDDEGYKLYVEDLRMGH